MHIEFLVEEQSCAEALKSLVPKIIGDDATHRAHVFQGKRDLLNQLPQRLRGYASWIPQDWRIVVLLDRDADDCRVLKSRLETLAQAAGLVTRTAARDKRRFNVLNRIVVEELEAWFFGDISALTTAYPRIPLTLASRRGFRNPDTIPGGTSEALERLLKKAGYYFTGMPKIEVARRVSAHMRPDQNQSHCFSVFRDALRQMVG
ncbi:MAG: DUF4276 family protein [Planctomycetota bacterium]|nr:DUF4276 family protein [Planctomycetota bacterium]